MKRKYTKPTIEQSNKLFIRQIQKSLKENPMHVPCVLMYQSGTWFGMPALMHMDHIQRDNATFYAKTEYKLTRITWCEYFQYDKYREKFEPIKIGRHDSKRCEE